jgi:hypothetical protein
MKRKTEISLIVMLMMIVSTSVVVTADVNNSEVTFPITVMKQVFNGTTFTDTANGEIGRNLVFRLTVIYDPTSDTQEKATDIIVVDTLPDCLEYNFSTAINYGSIQEYYGQSWIVGNQVYWNLTELFGIELYNETISSSDPDKFRMVEIHFNATVVDYTDLDGEENLVQASAVEVDSGNSLMGDASVTVIVEEPPEPATFTMSKQVWNDSLGNWDTETRVIEGETVTFKIEAMLETGEPVCGVSLKDYLPSFMCYVDSSEPPTYEEDDYIEWIVSMTLGVPVVIEIEAEACEVNEGYNVFSLSYDGTYLEAEALVVVDPANLAPESPELTGDTEGYTEEVLTFKVNTTDPEGDDVSYYVEFGDGNNSGWLGPFTSGTEQTVTHAYELPGEYTVKAKAKDTNDLESGYSEDLTVNINANLAPEIPVLTGDEEGFVGQNVTFTVNTTDPEGDDVYYYIEYGDGNNSGWLGPFTSGVEKTFSKHSYELPGEYTVKAKAKDTNDLESGYSEDLIVNITEVPPVEKIDVSITTGFGWRELNFEVENTGEVDFSNVECNIEGAFGLLLNNDFEENLTIENLNTTEKQTLTIDMPSGFGLLNVKVTVKAGDLEETAEASGLLLFRFFYLI